MTTPRRRMGAGSPHGHPPQYPLEYIYDGDAISVVGSAELLEPVDEKAVWLKLVAGSPNYEVYCAEADEIHGGFAWFRLPDGNTLSLNACATP